MKDNHKKGLWYLAHPYSTGNGKTHLNNFQSANKKAVKLLNLGYKVFSPISHSHPLQQVEKNDHSFWLSLDEAFMSLCDGLILCPGWESSKGCNFEKEWFEKEGKPIIYYEDIINQK